jgi:hypothetical protein
MKLLSFLFIPLLLCFASLAAMVAVTDSAVQPGTMAVVGCSDQQTVAPVANPTGSVVQAQVDEQYKDQILALLNTPAMRSKVEQIIHNQKATLSGVGIKDPQTQELLIAQSHLKFAEEVGKFAGANKKESKALDKTWEILKKVFEPAVPYVYATVASTVVIYALLGYFPIVGPALQSLLRHLIFGDGILPSLMPWTTSSTFAQRLIGGF